MSLKEWDEDIAPRLSSIGWRCKWLRHYADEVLARTRLLPSKPPFATEAEEEIDQAISTLELALSKLRDSKEEYAKKKVE